MERTYDTEWIQIGFEGLLDIIDKKDFEDPLYKLFIKMGLYSEYLEVVYKYFPKEQVKIFLFEEMKQNPLKVCRELFEMMNINPDFKPDVSVVHNKSAKTKSIFAAKILGKLRQNDNKFKILVKNLLPPETFFKLSHNLKELNKSKKKLIKPLSPSVRAKYQAFFKPYNKKLQEISGIDFSIWEKSASK